MTGFTRNISAIIFPLPHFPYCVFTAGELQINLGDILSFFTGADTVPPLGFSDATPNFNDENPYPTASTCSFSLTLPTQYHADFEAFKENFVFSVQNHGGFGLY